MRGMEPELERAVELVERYRSTAPHRPVRPARAGVALVEEFAAELSDDGEDPLAVLSRMADVAEPGLLHTGDRRFFGWVIGGALPVAVAADWLVAAWDQNVAAHACSPAGAAVEEVAAAWIRDLLGLPAHASYAFTTGCQMAHVVALAAARHRVLVDRGWDVESSGLAGGPPIRVLVGAHHETLLRAVRFLGIGTDAIVEVPQRTAGGIDVERLGDELRRGPGRPTIVALAAGDLDRGAFDDFAAACDVAHEHEAWVHVDGAFGLWAAASPRFRPLTEGIERADSWATDMHKWLSVPYDVGAAFVRDRDAHRAAMAIPAAYKVETTGVRDPFDWGPEWSRRARGFPVYATLRHLGRRGVAGIVEACCDRARELVAQLGALPNVEVLAEPIVNQGLVRFLDPGPAPDHDARTRAVIAAIVADGRAWFGPTTWRSVVAMRVSVSNWQTDAADVATVVEAVRDAIRQVEDQVEDQEEESTSGGKRTDG